MQSNDQPFERGQRFGLAAEQTADGTVIGSLSLVREEHEQGPSDLAEGSTTEVDVHHHIQAPHLNTCTGQGSRPSRLGTAAGTAGPRADDGCWARGQIDQLLIGTGIEVLAVVALPTSLPRRLLTRSTRRAPVTGGEVRNGRVTCRETGASYRYPPGLG